MDYVVYPGCLSSTEQYSYEVSCFHVLKHLNINFGYAENVNCCGFPIRSLNSFGWLYLSSRLMAVLEKYSKPCIILCNWCHASLTYAKKILNEDQSLMDWVNSLLSKEGLKYYGNLNFKHILELFHNDIGIEKLKSNVKKPLNGFKFSIHPGCLYFRPKDIGRLDDPYEPHMLKELVELLGAEVEVNLDCCGWAIYKTNPDTGLTLAGNRIKLASNTDGIIISCPHGGEMLDKLYGNACKTVGFNGEVPVLYYTQILGLSMDIEPRELALNLNKSPVNKILKSLTQT
ncbi:MAG: CoB--CoM heterodisulfide reductase iron-sulfur subunit B family protein [Candidatus Methanomethylicia archaeon]